MDILFRDQKLAQICGSDALRIRKYVPMCAELLRQRLAQFRAAKNLGVLRWLPQVRCHELKSDREGTLAVDLGHPYRLIFEPANNPIPRKTDGGLDWTGVTVIRVLSVEDYYG